MAKAKKITIASMMKAMEVDKNNKDMLVIGEGENRVEVVVKKKLTLFERADMVNSIVSMVWSQDENGTEMYAPYLRKFAYDFNILNYFTNIQLPDDMNKVWEFVDNADIAGMIIDFVGGGYIENIIREANEAIEYRKAEILKRSKFDSVFDSLSGIMKTVGNQTQNLDMKGMLELVEKYAPELKGELNKLLQSQMAESSEEVAVAPAETAE